MRKLRYNQIIFNIRDFNNSKEELYKAVADQLQLLLKTGNICNIYDADEKGGVVCIEYNHANALTGEAYPYWLFPDEITFVNTYQDEMDLLYHRKKVTQLEKKTSDIHKILEEEMMNHDFGEEDDEIVNDEDIYDDEKTREEKKKKKELDTNKNNKA